MTPIKPMTPTILASAVATYADTATWRDHPDFRKATTPMLLAYAAASKAIAALPLTARDAVPEFGLIIGVDHGEIEVTSEFLCTLKRRNLARPFLFQSALHNATLGFLSMQLKIHGPGVTTSTHYFGGEDALSMGSDFLASRDCDACICIGVESVDAQVAEVLQVIYGTAATPGTGAGAVILARPEFADTHFGQPARLCIDTITCDRSPRPSARQPNPPILDFYGANAAAEVAKANAVGNPAQLNLIKPDGASSCIVLRATACL